MVDYVRRWNERTEIAVCTLVPWLGITLSKFHDWRRCYPQSNGKLERFHGSIKGECIRPGTPISLEDAIRIVGRYVEHYQGVRFHTVSIPAPNMPPEATKFLGNPVEGVLGVSDTNAYFAIGKNAASTLKQIIDKSKADAGKAIAPAQLTIAATPIAKFAQAAAPPQNQAALAQVIAVLEQSAGKDKLTVAVKAIPNGASGRLEVDEGILKAIALMAARWFGPGAGAPPPAPGGPFGE